MVTGTRTDMKNLIQEPDGLSISHDSLHVQFSTSPRGTKVIHGENSPETKLYNNEKKKKNY